MDLSALAVIFWILFCVSSIILKKRQEKLGEIVSEMGKNEFAMTGETSASFQFLWLGRQWTILSRFSTNRTQAQFDSLNPSGLKKF